MAPNGKRTPRAGGDAIADALAPVRDALLAAARDSAAQLRAQADQAARDVLGQAQVEADEIRKQARDHGEVDSDELLAAERTQARRRARSVVLAAERAQYEALRAVARQAVTGLRDEPEYQAVQGRMAGSLRRLLGDEAQLQEAAGGGVVATAHGRRADLSLDRLADRAVDVVLAEDPRRSAEVAR